MSAPIGRPPAPRFYRLGDQPLGAIASGLLIATIIVAFLYLGRQVFEPMALAALLSLAVAPVVKRFRRVGLNRTLSVSFAVLLAISAIGALGYVIAMQASDLATKLPSYESNLRAKIRDVSGISVSSGAMEKASDTLRDLQKEIERPSQSAANPQPQILSPQPAPGEKPMVVEVREPPPTQFESIQRLLSPLISPLATTALVILFLIFILLQREDLRDRFLRLAGQGDLQRSTAAMNDAAARLGRFFLLQLTLNSIIGAIMGVCLWLIGIPNPILWGVLAGLMRFVPFAGTFIAAAFPLALAAAIDPGWTMVLATAALFLIVEPVVTNVVEPALYGKHSGLSPVAVIIATLFWTMLWGPIGLLLATPLTVCLVVLGRHVDSLSFLDILLGDKPALEPEERFYQRVLSGDATEAAEQAEAQLRTQALSVYYDAVPMKALALAQNDAMDGKLSEEKQSEIRDTVAEVIEDLADYDDVPPPEQPRDEDMLDDVDEAAVAPPPLAPHVDPRRLKADWRVDYPVLCVASRSPLDGAACLLLVHLLGKHGLPAMTQAPPSASVGRRLSVEAPGARLVCLSHFGAQSNPVHVRYLIRRLRRAMPQAKFAACFWLLDADKERAESWREAAGADFVATSLPEAVRLCVEQAIDPAVPPLETPEPVALDGADERPAEVEAAQAP